MWHVFAAAGKAERLKMPAEEASHESCRDQSGDLFQHKSRTNHQQRYFVARENGDHGEYAAKAEGTAIAHIDDGASPGGATPRRPCGWPVPWEKAEYTTGTQ